MSSKQTLIPPENRFMIDHALICMARWSNHQSFANIADLSRYTAATGLMWIHRCTCTFVVIYVALRFICERRRQIYMIHDIKKLQARPQTGEQNP